jgi:hypothetical protein
MRLRLTTLALLAALAVTGCGPGTPDVATAGGKAGAGATPTANATEQQARYEQCLREHGVEVRPSDKYAPVSPVPQDRVDAAEQACARYLPTEVEPEPKDPAELEKLRQFARCLREHGVPEWPDPDPRTGEFTWSSDEQAGAAKRNPKLPAAMTACEQYTNHDGTPGG